jgi:hypothetical protein
LIAEFCEWLQATSLAVLVSEDWFPLVESLHVVALALVAGTIFLVDTRLLGITSLNLRYTYISERLLPWTWVAFVCAVITGSLLFMANAVTYYSNTPFRIKMVLLLLAGFNMLYFQLVTFRSVANWDSGRPVGAARLSAAISLGLWCSVIAAGRWIGFV